MGCSESVQYAASEYQSSPSGKNCCEILLSEIICKMMAIKVRSEFVKPWRRWSSIITYMYVFAQFRWCFFFQVLTFVSAIALCLALPAPEIARPATDLEVAESAQFGGGYGKALFSVLPPNSE